MGYDGLAAMSFGNRAGTLPMRDSQTSAPVVEGDVLAGKYRVERVLGAGGMGVVVAARHLQLDQLVALKFVLPSSLEDLLVTERFLREAKAAVRLKSEHVAKVLDVGTLETGAPYIVMEYLEGSDLAGVIAEQAPLAVEVACDYLIQACEALSEAHTLGIVHRDLKPQNLFLTKGVGGAPLVKVLDFGISKIAQPEGAHNLTQTATVIGSPLYMAPEQMRSARDVDARSDIWALGVVLYELLTGRGPFEAETMTDLAIKIVQDPFISVDQLRPDLPPELAAVVHKCLEKNPANRFADAGELASALEPFAPVASRVIADRARKVISANQKTMGMVASPLLRTDGSGPVRAVSSPTHKSPTSPEWSDTKGKSGANQKVVAALLIVGAVAAGVTAIGVARLGVPQRSVTRNGRRRRPIRDRRGDRRPGRRRPSRRPPRRRKPLAAPATSAVTPPAAPSAEASAAAQTAQAPRHALPRSAHRARRAPTRQIRGQPGEPPLQPKPPGDDIPSLR